MAPSIEDGFFARPAPVVAGDLLGCRLLLADTGGLIVETEAYDRDDPASHSVRGPTLRNAAMFGPVGHLYVYRSYGMHWCLNIVCGEAPGSAVLIRALQPTAGLLAMQERRGIEVPRLLASGPGRVCQALGVAGHHNGASVTSPPFTLQPRAVPVDVATGPRIGITRAAERPWRFGLRGSPFLSRRFAPDPAVSAAGAPPEGRASPR